MEDQRPIRIFIDEEEYPLGSFRSPVNIEFDTTRLADGEHILKIVSLDPQGKEGIRKIPFTVRNGPAISVEGIKENQVVDGVLPIMISAYSKGDQRSFLIESSETPRSIPGWVWIGHIVFAGWAIYYLVTQFFQN
ncbi:MAG TPA: cytochrome C [Chitinophagaceae bacterium]